MTLVDAGTLPRLTVCLLRGGRPEAGDGRLRAMWRSVTEHWLLFGVVGFGFVAGLARTATNGGNLPLAGDGAIVITHEAEGEELGWRVTNGERLVRFGWITLRDAPGGKATFVAAHVEYAPVGGSLGAALSLMTGRSPRRLVADCLQRARTLLEREVRSLR